MKLSYNRKSADPIYYIQKGYRIGKKTTTKTIARIGKHSELLTITDDPLAYAQKKLEEMKAEEKDHNPSAGTELDFEMKVPQTDEPASRMTQLNIGHFYLQYVYQQLSLDTFFKKVTADGRPSFNCNQINRFTVTDLALSAASKPAEGGSVSNYYGKPDIPVQDLSRFLDILAENADSYIGHLLEKSSKLVTRNPSVCFFDCTRFCFKNEEEDYPSPVTGEGFCGYGPGSVTHPDFAAEMGLFMDSEGIPVSMVIGSGKAGDPIAGVPGGKKLKKLIGKNEFIYCGDAGSGFSNIRLFHALGGKAFVVTQAAHELPDSMKARIMDDQNYRLLSDNKGTVLSCLKSCDHQDKADHSFDTDRAYKVISGDSLIIPGLSDDKSAAFGKQKKDKSESASAQYVMVLFSREFCEYQRAVRNRRLECARKTLQSPDPGAVEKAPDEVKRYLKCVPSANSDQYILDEERIRNEEQYDGFTGVATNLPILDDSGEPIHAEICRIMELLEQRKEIADGFRILSRYYLTRHFATAGKHTTAHCLTGFTALLLVRLLEKELNSRDEHFTAAEILATLQNMNVAEARGLYYMSLYNEGGVLRALERYANLQLDRMYYLPKTLNKIVRSIR